MTRERKPLLSIKTTPKHIFEVERLRQLAERARAKRQREREGAWMAGVGTFTKPSTDLPRGYWRWQPEDDRKLVDLKKAGARHKAIARELGRTPSSVDHRTAYLRESGVLLCHREEEIDLLQRLLAEAQTAEVYGEEAA